MSFPLKKYKYECNDNKVTAISSYGGKEVRGYAKCDPRDTFSEEKGKKLAALRCGEKIARKRLQKSEKCICLAAKALGKAAKYYDKMADYYNDAKIQYIEAEKELIRCEDEFRK